jgi:nicotinamide phosphoribosyltransferase
MLQALSNADSYKLSHKGFMNEGTELIYSNMTPRSSKHFPVPDWHFDGKMVFFGLQHFIKDFLINEFNDTFFNLPKDEAIADFKRLTDAYLGPDSVPMDHFELLHDLGYLPIAIKALPEGSKVPMRVAPLVIFNTDNRFAWLTNYLETVMSCEIWKPCTTATLIHNYRRLINQYALETTGTIEGTELQIHGFEFRGMSNRKDAATNGAAFLLSSCGTDTMAALGFVEKFYKTDITQEFVGTSVPASEHSIACLGTSVEGELESYRRWITESYPDGIVSLVSDTYNYWKVLTEYLPELKDDIMNRPKNALGLSKVVIRPDSGDPVDIICGTENPPEFSSLDEASIEMKEDVDEECQQMCGQGQIGPEVRWKVVKIEDKYYELMFEVDYLAEKVDRGDKLYWVDSVKNVQCNEIELTPEQKGSIQLLWETFGGQTTEQGYKVLDEHIGLIYGDSMTFDRIYQICQRLKEKGFASTNVIFGVGSYSMNFLTRDSLGIAVKATAAAVDGQIYELHKDPVTDDGIKKSAKGFLRVEKDDNGEYIMYDEQNLENEAVGLLEPVFMNGELIREQSFTNIREVLSNE